MSIRLLALLPLLLSVACVSAERPDYAESGLPQRDDYLARWEQVSAKLLEGGHLSVERELHSGPHMRLHAIYVKSRLEAPVAPAPEVLIVVEGQGLLEAGAERFALEPGNVALLPRGSRGVIYGDETSPLVALVVRGKQGLGGTPQVLGEAEVFPREVIEPRKGNALRVIGSLPGAFTVRTVGVSGVIERHVHLEHDELVFVINGWGTLGMGREGEGRNFIAHPLRERSVVHMPARIPHEYADTSGRTLAISIYAPELADPKTDTYPIKQRGRVGVTQAFRPQDKKPKSLQAGSPDGK